MRGWNNSAQDHTRDHIHPYLTTHVKFSIDQLRRQADPATSRLRFSAVAFRALAGDDEFLNLMLRQHAIKIAQLNNFDQSKQQTSHLMRAIDSALTGSHDVA